MSDPNHNSSGMRMPWQPPPRQQQSMSTSDQTAPSSGRHQAAYTMPVTATTTTMTRSTMPTTYQPQQQQQQQQPIPLPIRHRNNNRGHQERKYRGIYSSSICEGMFQSTKTSVSKTDACALACCGVWLWERNQYIFTKGTIKPKTWKDRKMEFSCILLLLFYIILLNIFPDKRSSKTTTTTDSSSSSSSSSSTSGFNDDYFNEEDGEDDSMDFIDGLLLVVLIASISIAIWVMCSFSKTRTDLREQLAWNIFVQEHGVRPIPTMNSTPEEEEALEDYDQQWKIFLWKHKLEIKGGQHAVWSCIRRDQIWTLVEDRNTATTTTTTTTSSTTLGENHDDYDNDDNDEVRRDLCTVLWELIANCCCGICCNCWCQFCGMCAIAQEHRHLQYQRKMYLKQKRRSHQRHQNNNNNNNYDDDETEDDEDHDDILWHSDYITMQPWKDYMPYIHRLRRLNETNWSSHVNAMSQLSIRLYHGVQILLATIFLLMMTTHWMSGWEFLVLLGTLVQPIVILWIVYWWSHRLDISLDAVLKYFTSGFIICTSMSMIYEMGVSWITNLVLYVIEFTSGFFLATVGKVEMDDDITYNPTTEEYDTIPHMVMPESFLIAMSLLSAFLNSFIVASLVEEIAKYLCFWMVEHADMEEAPSSTSTTTTTEAAAAATDASDLLFRDEVEENESTGNTTTTPGGRGSSSTPTITPVILPRSFVSRGAAITVAMVTVALGFGCAENLLYVFVYTPPGLATEIITLVMRCMFPVHPLAAALQSIGVCRRELEQRQLPAAQRDGLGRIIFSAWFLHGLFDFVLMAVATYMQMEAQLGEHSDDDETGNGKPEYQPDPDDDTQYNPFDDLKASLPMSTVSFAMILVGFAYYIKEARAQRRRLNELDRLYPIHDHQSTSHPGSSEMTAAEHIPMTFGYNA